MGGGLPKAASHPHINEMDTEFERRISWDGESLRQLVILNPEDRSGLWRAMVEREGAMLSQALAEAVAEMERGARKDAPGTPR